VGQNVSGGVQPLRSSEVIHSSHGTGRPSPFRSFDEAERADDDYYASLMPEERLDILLAMIERYRSSLGEPAERFERVHRVVELSPG